MKVLKIDISLTVQTACRELESLKVKIGEEVSNVNAEDVQVVIGSLHRTVNNLSREINQSSTIAPLEPVLVQSLFNLMLTIQQTPAFSQALGPQQVELLQIFKRIENGIHKAESKVTKVDMDRLRP